MSFSPAFLRLFGRFIILVGLQVLLLNRLVLFNIGKPYLFLLFIISLPVSMPRWSYLLVAFFTGLVVDMFDHTWGMQAAACVFIAFMRKYVIELLLSRKEELGDAEPSLGTIGFSSYLLYTAVLVFGHHIFLLLVEAFSVNQLAYTIFKALLNSFFTLVLMVIVEILFFYRKSESN